MSEMKDKYAFFKKSQHSQQQQQPQQNRPQNTYAAATSGYSNIDSDEKNRNPFLAEFSHSNNQAQTRYDDNDRPGQSHRQQNLKNNNSFNPFANQNSSSSMMNSSSDSMSNRMSMPVPVSIPSRSTEADDRAIRRRMASPQAADPVYSGLGSRDMMNAAAPSPRRTTKAVATPGGNNVVFSLPTKNNNGEGSMVSPQNQPFGSAANEFHSGPAVAPLQPAAQFVNPFENSGSKMRGKRKMSDPDASKSLLNKSSKFDSRSSSESVFKRVLMAPVNAVKAIASKILPKNSKKDDDAGASFAAHKFASFPSTGAAAKKENRIFTVKNILFFLVMSLAVGVFYIWYTHDCTDEFHDSEHAHDSEGVISEGGHRAAALNEPLNPASAPGGIVEKYIGNSLEEFEQMYPFMHPVLHFFKRPLDHSAHNHVASISQPHIPFTLVSLLRDMTPEFLAENKASYIFQYNALLSWVRLTPHVLVYMDTQESCTKLTSRPEFSTVKCFPVPCMHDSVRRPLLNCIFEHSHEHSTTEAMGFVNGDIILSPDAKQLIDKIGNEFSKYLVVSRRTDTHLPEYLIDAYIQNYNNRLKADLEGTPFVPATAVDGAGHKHTISDNVDNAIAYAADAGVLHSEFGIDLFLYPKSTFQWMFPAFPPFLAGVYRWDNYFLTKMILHPDVSTIDASQFGLLVHQQIDGGKDHSKRTGAAVNDALVKQHLGSVYKLGHIKNVDYVLSGKCPDHCEIAPNVNASVHVLYAKRANKENWMAIIHVNANELVELNNFICWSNRAEFRNFLFLTRDPMMYEEIMKRDMPVIYLDRSLVDATNSPQSRGGNSDIESAASVLQRFDFLFSVLKAGYHFFYSSVRAVYLDDPLRQVSSFHTGEAYDVMVRGNNTHIASAPYNGPLAVRSTNYGQYFWKQVHDCADMNKHIADPVQWLDCVQHNWRVLKGGVKKGFFNEMKFTDANAFFNEKIPLTHGHFPVMISDESASQNVDKFNRLKSWGLMSTKASSPVCLDDLPSHRATVLKPPTDAPSTEFRLKVRVLTFNRHASLQRLLTALQTANYDNDRVDLEISIDYPLNFTDAVMIEDWKTTQLTARSFAWKHGSLEVIQQPTHIGLTGQWTQGWYPHEDNKEIMLFLEDDTGVSPYYYTWVKKMILTYYLNPKNYDPNMYGFALQTQHTILGETAEAMYGTRKVPDLLNATAVRRDDPLSTRYFRYQLVGTWGGVFFPQHWREFLIWLREKQFIHAEGVSPSFKPCVPLMVSNAWWAKKPHKVWSQWFVRFAFEKGWYNFYTNYPNQLSLVGNFREGGENFAITKGLMNEMVDEINSPPSSELYQHIHGDPLPTPLSSVPLYDLHFNEIENSGLLRHRLKIWGNEDNIPQCLTVAELKKQQKEVANKLKLKLEQKKKEDERRAKELAQQEKNNLANIPPPADKATGKSGDKSKTKTNAKANTKDKSKKTKEGTKKKGDKKKAKKDSEDDSEEDDKPKKKKAAAKDDKKKKKSSETKKKSAKASEKDKSKKKTKAKASPKKEKSKKTKKKSSDDDEENDGGESSKKESDSDSTSDGDKSDASKKSSADSEDVSEPSPDEIAEDEKPSKDEV